jgi:hypothetical protein
VCSGILTDSQQKGFEAIFSPPYSANLIHVGGRIVPENISKRLTESGLKKLKVKVPVVVAREILTGKNADSLRGWLNDNASQTVPGWISTVTGIVVPQAWMGLAADIFLQLMDNAGDAGRLTAANIAGTVTKDGSVGITEQVADDSSGKSKFIWTYIYQAKLNQQLITTPLKICSADIVMP